MAVPDLKDAIEHLQRKDLDAAIATLEHKVEELPAHLTAHVLLARTYEARHEWTKALTCWENAHFLMPNSPVAREGKARVLRRMDEAEQNEAEPDDEPSPASETSPETSPDAATEADDANAAPEGPTGNPSDGDSPSTSGPPSDLEQLRQQAEAEARSGGARPDLAAAASPAEASSPNDASGPATPEDRIDQLEEDDDLDHLIDELKSARIEPDPDAEETVPTPDLENDVDDLVSETLARIHEAQDQYREAAQIYVKLASQEPDRSHQYLEKAAEMREKADDATPDS